MAQKPKPIPAAGNRKKVRRKPVAANSVSKPAEVFEKGTPAWSVGRMRWLQALGREVIKPRPDNETFKRLWQENLKNGYRSLREEKTTNQKLDLRILRSSLTALLERTADNRFQEALEAVEEYHDQTIITHRLRRQRQMREADRENAARIGRSNPDIKIAINTRAKFTAAWLGVTGPVDTSWDATWKYARKVLATEDKVYEEYLRLKAYMSENDFNSET